jgi:outer membrane receptor protein involved in Fe transport
VIGTGKSYAQDDNKLVMPGYAYVNAFINFAINKSMTWSFNGNNLFNQIGITEAEEGSITEGQNNIIRGRSIAGRSITSTLRITF